MLNTGRVRDQWHTMTRTGLSAAPRRARRRAVRRDAPRRCGGAGPRAGHAGARRDGARRGAAARHAERGPAAGLAVRADPLVGREQLGGPHRRAGAAAHRSLLRPARGQGDAGAHRPLCRSATTASSLSRRPVPTHRPRLLGARAHAGRDMQRSSRSTRRPRELERTGASACCRRASASPTRTQRSRQYRTAVLRDGRLEAVLYVAAEPEPAVARMAQDLLRPARIDGVDAPLAAGGAAGRGRGSRGRSCAPASRSGASASRRRRRRRQLASPRSARPRAPAPTAAPACPSSSACSARRGRPCLRPAE